MTRSTVVNKRSIKMEHSVRKTAACQHIQTVKRWEKLKYSQYSASPQSKLSNWLKERTNNQAQTLLLPPPLRPLLLGVCVQYFPLFFQWVSCQVYPKNPPEACILRVEPKKLSHEYVDCILFGFFSCFTADTCYAIICFPFIFSPFFLLSPRFDRVPRPCARERDANACLPTFSSGRIWDPSDNDDERKTTASKRPVFRTIEKGKETRTMDDKEDKTERIKI